MTDDSLYKLSAYDFHLPHELIAHTPCIPRDQSRLMIVDRASGNLSEMRFCELNDFLNEGDRLIFNNTKVIKARLEGKRNGGGKTEIFLIKRYSNGDWEVLVKPAKKLKLGSVVAFGKDFFCRVVEEMPEGIRQVHFHSEEPFDVMLERYGKIPLPHYIKAHDEAAVNEKNYQTVFAECPGASAAPTAGLHFTPELLRGLDNKNVEMLKVTLHVGLGTFRPVKTEDIRNHRMHTESFIISPEAARMLNKHHADKREICVGTTCCRTLETAADVNGLIHAGESQTAAYIYPGYQFKYVKSLLTNFHWPQSSLLMLVSAFAGYELTMEAYRKAVKERYRFFSYGDAMLII